VLDLAVVRDRMAILLESLLLLGGEASEVGMGDSFATSDGQGVHPNRELDRVLGGSIGRVFAAAGLRDECTKQVHRHLPTDDRRQDDLRLDSGDDPRQDTPEYRPWCYTAGAGEGMDVR
jgi:hypothetical protein